MNKLLMEENDRLQKQVSHLVYENGYMRTQLQSVSSIILHLSHWKQLYIVVISYNFYLLKFVLSLFSRRIRNFETAIQFMEFFF